MDPLAEPRCQFRALPRWAQWVVGVPLVALCIHEAARGVRAPRPDEPVQAFWFQLLLLVAAVVIGELVRPTPKFENERPAGLGEFRFPTATEGRPVPLVWGRVRLDGPNVIWYGDLRAEAITQTIKTGFFSKEKITTGYRYNVGIQMALCRGPGVVLKRAWVDDDEVFNGTLSTDGARFDVDQPSFFGGSQGNGGLETTVDFYTGTTTQPVNAYLDDTSRQRIAAAATPTAPRYIGTSYVVLRELTSAAAAADDEGAYIGNSTQVAPWAFEVERYPAIFSGQSVGDNQIGAADANPINVIYEILTNVEFGFGEDPADIDVGAGSSFLAASDTVISEGNGFSLALDTPRKVKDILAELQRQIDGVIYPDPSTGKWAIKLARFDYDIDLVPQATDSNVRDIRDFTRGAWEDTTNQIAVKYSKRDDDYKDSYALAQDMANALIRGGGTVSTFLPVVAEVTYPGVKDSILASQIAWRDLRTQSYPLARCALVVDRTFWDVTLGSVIALTSASLGLTKLPLRVSRIDYGRLQQNEITLTCVQDIFQFAEASYGAPAATGWVPPAASLTAFPADEQHGEECPRGILVRDPDFAGDDTVSKAFVAARRQTNEVGFEIRQRNAAGSPSGTFADAGACFALMRIGALDADLAAGTAIPTATITINATPDTQSALESVFDDAATLSDLGVGLSNMVKIGDEFMLVSSAANGTGTDVDLQGVYRGILDSPQQAHSAGDDVLLVFVGSNVTDVNFPSTNNVELKLLPRSTSSTLPEGEAATIAFQMARRPIRPYPPAAIFAQGSATPFNTPDLEGQGSALNGFGFDVDWRRRRYTATDELQELLQDNAVSASTEYQVRVFVDPGGANVEVPSSPFGWATGSGPVRVERVEIVNEAAAGTAIRVRIETRHDVGTEVDLEARYDLDWDPTPTSALSGLFYLSGDLSSGVPSNAFVVAEAGVHTVRIGASYSAAVVEHRINGGSWTAIIGTGSTSGTTASLSVSDTIELRVTANESPARNFVEIENPSAADVAYGVFTDGS